MLYHTMEVWGSLWVSEVQMSFEDNKYICDNCGKMFQNDDLVTDSHYEDHTFCSYTCLTEYKYFDGGDDNIEQ